MGRLTTHVLDTTNGKPAAGVAIRLFSLAEQRKLISSVSTNFDGRTDKALLDETSISAGTFELEFDIGEYFARRDLNLAEPAFLGTVIIRFSIRPDENYHVPLLASPWAYSTYRGS
jgi:5-hydroxyisourate hydrolase